MFKNSTGIFPQNPYALRIPKMYIATQTETIASKWISTCSIYKSIYIKAYMTYMHTYKGIYIDAYIKAYIPYTNQLPSRISQYRLIMTHYYQVLFHWKKNQRKNEHSPGSEGVQREKLCQRIRASLPLLLLHIGSVWDDQTKKSEILFDVQVNRHSQGMQKKNFDIELLHVLFCFSP